MDKDYRIFHITWVTHSSRISARMRKYNADKKLEPTILSLEQEIEITKYISQIVRENKIKIFIYNICCNHVHLLLFCENDKRDNIVRKMKGRSTQLYKNNHDFISEFHLWAQKYNYWTILSENQLTSTYEYIKNNRVKHSLPKSGELERIIEEMITPFDKLFD
jgi:REP element-mobilizing transposase RayT